MVKVATVQACPDGTPVEAAFDFALVVVVGEMILATDDDVLLETSAALIRYVY